MCSSQLVLPIKIMGKKISKRCLILSLFLSSLIIYFRVKANKDGNIVEGITGL